MTVTEKIENFIKENNIKTFQLEFYLKQKGYSLIETKTLNQIAEEAEGNY